jgi:flagellar protein FliS
MGYEQARSALKQYQQVGAQTSVATASPYRLIQMLMEGALQKIAMAKSHLQAKRLGDKAQQITSAMDIIDGLRISLDKSAGGEIAQNLEDLYDYMNRRLLEANAKNDAAMLDEVASLMAEIKSGWDGIEQEARRIEQQQSGEMVTSTTSMGSITT